MAFTLTIAGVTKTFKAGSLELAHVANGRATSRFDVVSLDGTYRPALDADVIFTENGNRVFGGLVDIPREAGPVQGSRDTITTAITAIDYNTYAERRIVSFSFGPDTLKNTLQFIVDTYLTTGFGVTLDAGQATGPTLPLLAYTIWNLRDVLNDISKITGTFGEPFVGRIDDFKVLSMKQPSTNPAPFDIDDSGGLPITEVVGDVEVEEIRSADYANNVVVYAPPVAQANRTETFTGDGVTDTFTLAYTLTRLPGTLTNNAAVETLSLVGGGGIWEYDSTTNEIQRVIGGAPAAGASISIEFDGTFTVLVNSFDIGEITAHGVWDRFLTIPDVPNAATAQAIADAELARVIIPTQVVRYQTLETGLVVGQSQGVIVARRNLNTTGFISELKTREDGVRLIRDVTLTIDGSQTNVGKNFRDVYRQWAETGGVSSGTSIGGGTLAGTSGAGAPVESVQFNRVGAFGGNAAFLFKEANTSLICGSSCTITAANTVSCQVFGDDCHIA
jgi:hypothetical protein